MTGLSALALLTAAWAEIPPPSYERALGLQGWAEVDHLMETGDPRAAIARADALCDTVVETAGLRYLTGLAWRRLGRDERALALLTRSAELDPTYPAPWYDLGELHLIAGRWAEAEIAFTEVSNLVATGPNSELGPMRLAEVAAHQRRPDAFETHLREAIRRGLALASVVEQPQWRDFYQQPELRDSIEKMITVYGDPDLLDRLTPTTP